MKIQLSSTLPFTPVQLDARHVSPRRAVGQLHGVENGREFSNAVYEFRHSDDEQIHYQIDPQERVYLDEIDADDVFTSSARSAGKPESLEWLKHEESHSYKPYSFLVMNAMTRLIGDWDGVVYRTPRGERLRDSALTATLQIIDACVCNRFGLWAMVKLGSDKSGLGQDDAATHQQMGWVQL